MIARDALVAVSTSGGKDSQAMTILLSRIVPRDQFVAVHAPLAEVEWPGTIEHIERTLADTDSHVIETAMARIVMACALKHHTRRDERDPERWQLASQLVTHALLRDSGFTLPPDAEAWEGVSVEQAYDRLPEPQEDDSGGDSDSPSVGGDIGAGAAAASGGGDEGASDSPSDSSGEGDGETQDG